MSEPHPNRRATDLEQPHAIERLKWPLWANAVATAMLVLALGGVVIGIFSGFRTGVRWVDAQENLLSANQAAIASAAISVGTLQGNIVSLDKRVNDLSARVLELHNMSEAADRELKARLDTIDALSRANTERSFQPPLPQPKQGPR